jgi:hypothetical protein
LGLIDGVDGDHRRRERLSGGRFGGNTNKPVQKWGLCGELVELLFYWGIMRVLTGKMWKSLFHVEHSARGGLGGVWAGE